MKHTMKKIQCLLFSVMLICICGINVFAADKTTMSITLRIEGIKVNMFYKTVEVPYTDSLTLQAALKYIDTQESSITITGVDNNYISDINGEASGKFGGYDGWLYRVNNTEPATGIDGYMLKDGDSVVLYYGDPFGVGMQYPVADTSKIKDGIIKFTSSDTTYDANFNPTVTVNPVVGATITWNYGNTSATYTTDKNGEIKIENAQLTAGTHSIQIAKINDKGIPLILRYASDYSISIASNSSQTETTGSTTITPTTASKTSDETTQLVNTQSETSNPKTGDEGNASIFIVMLSIMITGITAATVKGRKHSYEK